ncbi:MAG: DUF4234 domain-containing protein [Defluviitaleaceae bacterium]|nr:DUF4234 domain-containing protein [Defluviitaleaceae bacterium]
MPKYSIIEERNVGVSIVLSIVTCGIYMIYWWYKVLDDLYKSTNRNESAGMSIILSIITCGIYGIYLYYKKGQMEAEMRKLYGHPPRDDSILYLILAIFSLQIIALAIVQSNLNKMVHDVNDAYSNYHQKHD